MLDLCFFRISSMPSVTVFTRHLRSPTGFAQCFGTLRTSSIPSHQAECHETTTAGMWGAGQYMVQSIGRRICVQDA